MCDHENPTHYRYCHLCGDAINSLLCRCGFANLLSSKYCGYCGQCFQNDDTVNDKDLSVYKKSSKQKYKLSELMTCIHNQHITIGDELTVDQQSINELYNQPKKKS